MDYSIYVTLRNVTETLQFQDKVILIRALEMVVMRIMYFLA